MSRNGWRMNNRTFTDKHRELFPYLAANKTDREIADELGVSVSAIYQRILHMMDVIKCAERADLEQFCREVLEDASSDAS